MALLSGVLAACSRATTPATLASTTDGPPPAAAAEPPTAVAAPGVEPVDYGDSANWLCRPGKTGTPCTVNIDATVVEARADPAAERFQPADMPAIDCFYVYPTVSNDTGLNSDLLPGGEERQAATRQFARFGSVCRLFAPMYRQVTNTAGITGRYDDPLANAIADADVLNAWQYYLAHDNGGRGVILVGHSQGSQRLIRLIQDRIDPNPPVLARLVAAYLIGWGVRVPPGADVGGDFQNIPACRKPGQVHCVVTFASFSAESPPPEITMFGRGGVLCVNPSALAGGAAGLHPYFLAAAMEVADFLKTAVPGDGVLTPFVALPGQLRAECVDENGASYLKITADPRLPFPKYLQSPEWGLHGVEVDLTLGDLVALAARQASAYR